MQFPIRCPHGLFKILLACLLAFSGGNAFAEQESTIFSYDGQDFVRVDTTLTEQEGKSAANTKLDRNDPSYKALIEKRSYSGDATLFGQTYRAYYAPLTNKQGDLTGAIFVGKTK